MRFFHIERGCLGAQPRFLLCAGSARRAGREILGGCGLPSPMGEGARPADGGNGRAGEGWLQGKAGTGTKKSPIVFTVGVEVYGFIFFISFYLLSILDRL